MMVPSPGPMRFVEVSVPPPQFYPYHYFHPTPPPSMLYPGPVHFTPSHTPLSQRGPDPSAPAERSKSPLNKTEREKRFDTLERIQADAENVRQETMRLKKIVDSLDGREARKAKKSAEKEHRVSLNADVPEFTPKTFTPKKSGKRDPSYPPYTDSPGSKMLPHKLAPIHAWTPKGFMSAAMHRDHIRTRESSTPYSNPDAILDRSKPGKAPKLDPSDGLKASFGKRLFPDSKAAK